MLFKERSGREGTTVVSVLLGQQSKSAWVRTPPSPSKSISLFLYHIYVYIYIIYIYIYI